MNTWLRLETVDYGDLLVRAESIFSINECNIKGNAGVGYQKPDTNGCVVTLMDGSGHIVLDKLVVKESINSLFMKL